MTPIKMNAKKISLLQNMVKLKLSQLRSFIRKSSNTQVISVVCKSLLNAVNGIVPVGIPNLKNFEGTYKILINPKTSLEKKISCYIE